VQTLALDPATGDIALSAGHQSLATGADAVRTRLYLRLSLWREEYGLNTAEGIPYAQLLGRKGALPVLLATLRRAIATCPGVAEIASFSYDHDPQTRALTVTFEVRTVDGEVTGLDAFVVGVLA
jgi:hypothetical protein